MTVQNRRRALHGRPVAPSPSMPLDDVEWILDTVFEVSQSDIKSMYSTRTNNWAKLNDDLSANYCINDLRKALTYGEVAPRSVDEVLVKGLNVDSFDVFYDLGCGRGKIVAQVALQCNCIAKGIELVQDRISMGTQALKRLKALEGLSVPRNLASKISIICGDICSPPSEADLSDATVVFINNVCFDSALMLKILGVLSHAKGLRKLVTLRKLCDRHRQALCSRNDNLCIQYRHPPQVLEVDVSWASGTTAFIYDRRPL